MTVHHWLRNTLACAALLGVPMLGMAAQHAGKAKLAGQVQAADAKVAAAREHNVALQSQVAQLEQANAARQQKLQQRDAEIAELQRKLQAAGVAAPVVSSGS